MPAAASPRSAAARAKPTPPPTGAGARRDPKPRHTDGTQPWMQLEGKDPSKRYVSVSKTGNAVEEYAMMGYDISHYGGQDGLRFKGGNTVRKALGRSTNAGDVLESFGHVIMEIDLETYEHNEQHGDGFGLGQDYGDRIEKRMHVGRGGMEDPFRGMPSSMQRVARIGNNNSGRAALERIMPEQAAVEASAEEAEAAMFGDESDPLTDALDNDGDV